MREAEPELREINNPHLLGVHLGIPTEDLKRFEEDHRGDVTRQRTEVINYWLRNFVDTTWNTLATAVERIGGHRLLVTRLRSLAQGPSQENEPGMFGIILLTTRCPVASSLVPSPPPKEWSLIRPLQTRL